MPMPAANAPWPPKEWAPAYDQYAENDAWLTGDVKTLQTLYTGQQGATHTHNGAPYRGGIAGVASRLFWGRPVPQGEQRTRLHVPAAADLATLASDLQYSDPPVTDFAEVTDGATVNDKARTRLDLIMNSDDTHATLNSMGEVKSALGASIIIPRWDADIEDHVWLDYAAADAAIPTFKHRRLVEVTLWSEFVDGNVYWRHLEHHGRGYIEHALFRGSQTSLGARVPLQERPETESYAALVDGESRIPTQIDRLTAGYLPNAPALSWRKSGQLADAGRSDFNQCIPLFDALDETFSSWMRDLKLGAGKLIVPEAYLRNNGAGAGASFDMFQEMFVGLSVPGKVADGLDLTPSQFEIRVEQHEQTMRGIMREILRKAGYSPSSWGDPDEKSSQVTATEIQQRNAQTERTRSKKNLYDRRVLSRMGSVALELDGLIFQGKGGGKYDLNVVFPELSRTDPKTEAETIGLLNVAGAISAETAVRRANPDWDDTAVTEEVNRIQARKEENMPPDPFSAGRVDEAEE
ncbi:phage portal protein [Leucobacter viscericola]|uniref:Phage portal protein n=1 Tax=Leucobacter viscericola TaxID=2714935 RepID=A0A6G7XIG4_9MICO|nr:phage portal protein [Leucobacter viscericola]QIK64158.1 phage portal protein [Leucobacter viscericola]